MIPIQTPKGAFHVWTKRVGKTPASRCCFCMEDRARRMSTSKRSIVISPAPASNTTITTSSASSDQPDMRELWELPRFVEEVEQVRPALGLDQNNFYLLGQSRGGILAIEYALMKYQHHLKVLIISNMVASIPAYNEYAQRVLMPAMDQRALAEIKRLEAAEKYENPRATWNC